MVLSDRLIRAVDWFVPAELQENTANLWRARIFVISHVLGPFSAVTGWFVMPLTAVTLLLLAYRHWRAATPASTR